MDKTGPGQSATVFGVLAIVLIAAGLKTHNGWFVVLGFALASIGAALFLKDTLPRALDKLQQAPGIGMGASVAEDAVIEPGARVEMGASIGRGAVIKAGAVVRMGASIGRGAVVESGAVVSWGADVQRDAQVGAHAVVGAGSTVKRGAQVPAGVRLFPGSDYGGKGGQRTISATPLEEPAPAPLADPREARTAAVCEKLEAELKASPEHVRDFLAGSGQTVASLRRTCEDLLARERALRAEIGDDAGLQAERAGVEKRLQGEPDEQIRISLMGALAAMDEVKKQRDLLRVGADRLQAEHTRLLYTLEALASQFVRLRTAGKDTGAGAELQKSVAQLRDELQAITDALEQLSQQAPMAALASPPPRDDELRALGKREKTR